MAWVRLDDNFPEHPKIDAAGPEAAWLHVCAIAYSSRNLTDGFIAHERVPRLAECKTPPRKLAERLITVGLWEETPGGYRIHDYHDYNPTKAEVLAEREARYDAKARAGRAGGIASGVARRKHKRSKPEADSEANTNENEAPSRPVPSPPLTSTESRQSSTDCHTDGDDDDPFQRAVQLIVQARMNGRHIDRPRAYQMTARTNTIHEDGELIRRLLNDGTGPEQTALFVLGHGFTTQQERSTTPVPWCPPDCTTCDGDAWIDTGNGLAPCPERKTA